MRLGLRGFAPLDNEQKCSMGKSIRNYCNQNATGPIRRNKRCLTGFTLIEAVIAIGVVGFILLAIVGLVLQNILLTDFARMETIALSHANAVLEEMRTRSYTSLNSITSQDWGTWAANNGYNTLEQETVNVAYGGSTNPLEIDATVRWQLKTRSQYVRLSTVMTDRGDL
ncbi:MAG: hypothetical protein PHE61_04850 [Candidatus Omnitrophica bacterium]|nr:hypothetical protein [Candidatus Omnitrophota bacterium]